MMNPNQYYNQYQNPVNPVCNPMQMQMALTRITKEFQLCKQDNDLIQIGCSFGLEDNNNVFVWKVTMLGPRNTPYDGGLFTINVAFPWDYPNHGPEFKFKNKIYHLNVDMKNDFGHICINSLNEWKGTGRVTGKPVYTVKQALFDIFCLFYNQGIESAYDENMKNLYVNNPAQFAQEAQNWTKQFASLC